MNQNTTPLVIKATRIGIKQHPEYSYKEIETYEVEFSASTDNIQTAYGAVLEWVFSNPMARLTNISFNVKYAIRGATIIIEVDKAN